MDILVDISGHFLCPHKFLLNYTNILINKVKLQKKHSLSKAKNQYLLSSNKQLMFGTCLGVHVYGVTP